MQSARRHGPEALRPKNKLNAKKQGKEGFWFSWRPGVEKFSLEWPRLTEIPSSPPQQNPLGRIDYDEECFSPRNHLFLGATYAPRQNNQLYLSWKYSRQKYGGRGFGLCQTPKWLTFMVF
jgi:hypothetical protein